MELFSCRNVCLAYGQRTVVHDVTFSLNRGDLILVCGENGSGKSTLTRALVGLFSPASGEIRFGDGVREGIGYLPQKAGERAQFPASAFEVASLGLRQRSPFLSKKDRAAVRRALCAFGARELEKESFSSLSGGQRQRVLLARALLSAKSALILDEPLTGLDPLITREVYRALKSAADEGLGVLFVSHDVAGALDFCTHILHLCGGEHAHFYTVEEYKKSAHFCALCEDVHHA